MKKVIILRKVQATNQDFRSTSLQTFRFENEEKKKSGNEAVVCSQSFLKSSRSQIFFKKCAVKNFANFTGKHVCIKKRLQHRCFPVKFAKFLRPSFFTEHLRCLLLKLNIYMFQMWIYYILEQEISIGLTAMRKKLKIFMLQLPIYYILEQKISTGTNADIGKTMREKQNVFVVDGCNAYSTKILEREGSISPCSFYGLLPDCQSHVLDLSTQQMSFSFCSWCS